MGLFVAALTAEEWYGGAVAVAACIGLFFLISRIAYVRDVRRRRRLTPQERRAEREGDT